MKELMRLSVMMMRHFVKGFFIVTKKKHLVLPIASWVFLVPVYPFHKYPAAKPQKKYNKLSHDKSRPVQLPCGIRRVFSVPLFFKGAR